MPSTYTLNNGITLIATGEQSGTWGATTNVNLELVDTALDGQVTITLASAGSSGSPNALPISDGAASNGRNRMVIFDDGGDLGATVYVQLTPNDSEKIIYVRNALSGSRSILLFQGTYNASNDYEVPAGTTAVVYFNGGGTGAVAANVFNNAYFDGLRLGSVSVTSILDEDNMASDSATALATQQSIKAYVDSQVGTVDTLAEILANGNTTGGTDIVVSSGDAITTNTINETTAASGVTIDSLLVKDGGITAAGTSTFAGQTITDLGAVTTADINGGTIDGTVIGGSSAAAGTFTTGVFSTSSSGDAVRITQTGSGNALVVEDSANPDSTPTLVDASGNVGIGTTPSYRLHISNGSSIGTAMQLETTGSGHNFDMVDGTGTARFRNVNGEMRLYGDVNSGGNGNIVFLPQGTSSEAVTIDSSGNVGIGTSTVTTGKSGGQGIELVGNGNNFRFTGTAATSTGGIEFFNSSYQAAAIEVSGGSGVVKIISDPTDVGASSNIQFEVDGTEHMRIDSSGNVGIGTSSPGAELDIESTAPEIQLNDSDGVLGGSVTSRVAFEANGSTHGRVGFGTTAGNMALTNLQGNLFIQADTNDAHADSYISLSVDNSTKMRILDSGYVGIGETEPSTLLHLASTGSAILTLEADTDNVTESDNARIEMSQDGGATTGHMGYGSGTNGIDIWNDYSDYVRIGTNNTERMRIDSSGNVGIGTTPSYRLHISNGSTGGTLMQLETTGSGNNFDMVDGTGTARVRTVNGEMRLYGDVNSGGDGNIVFLPQGTTERMRIDSSGRLLVGSTSITSSLGAIATFDGTVFSDTENRAANPTFAFAHDNFSSDDNNYIMLDRTDEAMQFSVAGSERMRITSDGYVGINNTEPAGLFEIGDAQVAGSNNEDGFSFETNGQIRHSTNQTIAVYMTDTSSSAGIHNYIVFRYQGTTIGDIDTLDNSTIRYNTFTGAHWAQFTDHSQPEIPLGTVMSTINEMCNHTQFEYVDEKGETQKTDIAGSFEIGSTHTIYIDEDGAQAEGTAISQSTHKRLVKVKVSDTAGDKSVYGVFAGHYKDGDSSIESLGLGAIRVGSGVTVANGDLLESAGDGTARPQTGDNADLFKASTIAKVTSTTVIETYDDGSYTVPCTLHCG